MQNAFPSLLEQAQERMAAMPGQFPEAVDDDPVEDVPWREPDLINAGWAENGKKFKPGTRYLCGHPISVEQCRTVLRSGFQRQRAAAALELALLAPGKPLFEIRSPGFRQQQQLPGT
jgi:hypothetical protein